MICFPQRVGDRAQRLRSPSACQKSLDHIPAWLAACMTLSKLLSFSESQFFHLWIGEWQCYLFSELWWDLTDLMSMKHTEFSWHRGKCPVICIYFYQVFWWPSYKHRLWLNRRKFYSKLPGWLPEWLPARNNVPNHAIEWSRDTVTVNDAAHTTSACSSRYCPVCQWEENSASQQSSGRKKFPKQKGAQTLSCQKMGRCPTPGLL